MHQSSTGVNNDGERNTYQDSYFQNSAWDMTFSSGQWKENNIIANNIFNGSGVSDTSHGNFYCIQNNKWGKNAKIPKKAIMCGCVDKDNDGTFAIGNCTVGNDCDDNNSALIGIYQDTYINSNVKVCKGTYKIPEGLNQGVLIVNKSGVTLDCDGSTIIGNGGGIGINVFRQSGTLIKNCNIYNYNDGISLYASNLTTISNSISNNNTRFGVRNFWSDKTTYTKFKANGNSDKGIDVQYSNNIIISKSELNNNKNFGAYLKGSNILIEKSQINDNANGLMFANNLNTTVKDNYFLRNQKGIYSDKTAGNLVYNNYFNNTQNLFGNFQHTLSVVPVRATNIIGGPYIAGNFYHDYIGFDVTKDGLGDTPYQSMLGTDNYPLTTVSGPKKGHYVRLC